ncbi:MAG: pyrroline-5-carboxylate reductase [Oscillospiraceae bacterium]
MFKIGLIGFGNMAKAICGGILKAGLVAAADICTYDLSQDAMQAASDMGVNLCKNEIELTTCSRYVFLCVKPQGITEVLNTIKPQANARSNVFLSIAAGITTKSIQKILGEDMPIIRAMPNTPLLLACGTIALCKTQNADEESYCFIKTVFKSVGSVYEIPEEKFNEIINVNGSTPAYIYLFAETVAKYAQISGIDYGIALQMFCDTLIGSARMMKESGKTPNELIEMVSSKGGTTVAAIESFKANGFSDVLEKGMNACVKRAYELSL